MSLTIFPLTAPPTDRPTLLEHVAAFFTLVVVLNMLTAHIRWEPGTDDLDSLWCHIVEVTQLEVIIVGSRGIVVGGTNGVSCTYVGLRWSRTCEDRG